MVWMTETDCSWFQVVNDPKVEREETSTDAPTEVIWVLVRPALALPRAVNVSAVTVLMLDARAADTY